MKPMFELVVYPACLDCRFRELEETSVYGPLESACDYDEDGKLARMSVTDGTRRITICRKLPVCKRVDGQERIRAERGL